MARDRYLPFVGGPFIWVTVTALLTSCYMGKKIEQPLVIYVDSTAFFTEAVSHVAYVQYLDNFSIDAYTEHFLQALINEAGLQEHIRLADATTPADYVLELDHFVISESESTETVNDAKSPYNGQSYVLSHITSTCDFKLLQGDKILGDYTADMDKDEKLKNGQTLVQLAAGWNKDHTQYREKLLPDDVCYAVAGKCGQRTWNLFTQKLAKKLK